MIDEISIEINGKSNKETTVYLAKILSDLLQVGLLDARNASITLYIDQNGVVRKMEKKEQFSV